MTFHPTASMRCRTPLLVAALLAGVATSLPAQATLRPQPSTRATTAVELVYPRGQAPAGATPLYIRLDYGQPHLRGRAINSDSLVPFDQPWRTGANDPTTLTTDVDITLGGKPLAKGAYRVWTLPTRAGWTLILQRHEPDATMQQEMRYDATKDVARVALRQQALGTPLESFTMWILPSTQAGAARGELRMAWGVVQLSTDWQVR